jgi:hypothetical protein
LVVQANILHHGVEMFLKAILSRADMPERIRQYGHQKKGYGHSLVRLWQELKARNPTIDFTSHDGTVAALDKFEDIRYPEELVSGGAQIVVNIHDVPPVKSTNPASVPEFELSLPAIDRLMALLFGLAHYNPETLRMHLRSEHAVSYHNLHNTSPMLTFAPETPSTEHVAPSRGRLIFSNGWLQGLIFVLLSSVVALGISDYYAREAAQDAREQLRTLQTHTRMLETQLRMTQSLLASAEEHGLVELVRDGNGNITGGRVIRLEGGATSESRATGDLTTGPERR